MMRKAIIKSFSMRIRLFMMNFWIKSYLFMSIFSFIFSSLVFLLFFLLLLSLYNFFTCTYLYFIYSENWKMTFVLLYFSLLHFLDRKVVRKTKIRNENVLFLQFILHMNIRNIRMIISIFSFFSFNTKPDFSFYVWAYFLHRFIWTHSDMLYACYLSF